MVNKNLQDALLLHVSIVILFLIMPTISFVRPPDEPFLALTRIFVQDTMSNLVLLCFFYLNYYLLLPKFFFNQKYLAYFVFVFLYLALAFAFPFFVGKFFPNRIEMQVVKEFHPSLHELPHFDRSNFSIYSFAFEEFRRHIGLFFSAIFFSFFLKTRQNLALLKEDKLKAELSSLKSQINPHFLFNTLNSIYALSLKKDDHVSEAIMQLSGLMRYVIKDASEINISLSKELEYLDNYIALQKARIRYTTEVNYQKSGTINHQKIAPLILITYIENAFKYGVNPDTDGCKIDIRIQVADNSIFMEVFNFKATEMMQIESTGIGMTNTLERLKLLYPNKYKIAIVEDSGSYLLKLSIDLI